MSSSDRHTIILRELLHRCAYLREERETSPDIVRNLSLDETVALRRDNGRVDEAKKDGRVDSVH